MSTGGNSFKVSLADHSALDRNEMNHNFLLSIGRFCALIALNCVLLLFEIEVNACAALR
jgi:hypothetical protein